MKLLQAFATLISALLISTTAAYFSIVGLAALFAATFIPVIILACVLEAGKIVAATWLHANWRNARVGVLHKAYLLAAIGALMIITAVGIYGFLSKGHLEQKAPLASYGLQIQQYEQHIGQVQADSTRLQTRLDQLDKSIDAYLKNDRVSKGLKARDTQKPERDAVQTQLDNNVKEVARLNDELLPLKVKSQNVEASLGPVKYVAELFGWSDVDRAVRLLILILMFAFDPLAIVLILSSSISFEDHFRRQPAAPAVATGTAITALAAKLDIASADNVITPQAVTPPPPASPGVSPTDFTWRDPRRRPQ